MKYRSAGVLLVALLTLASCGTRLPDSAFESSASQRVATNGGGGSDSSSDDFAFDDTTATTLADLVDGNTGGSNSRTGTNTNRSATSGPSDDGPNKASDVGITENTITLGNITAENGVLGDAFAPAVRGLRAWVAATNAKGGIRGRNIVLKTCDDREDRNRSLACAQQLVERDKVFALVSTNTRAFGGAAQYLADREIPVIGFPITNSFYRYPTFFSVYGSSYPRDGKTVGYNGKLANSTGVYRWFKQTMNLSKAAVFAYDIDESKQAGAFMEKGAKLEGFEADLYTVSFAAPSFDQHVADMQRKGTEIVFDAMDDGANRKLCDAMARRNFQPKAKVSTIVVMGGRVGTDYNDTCRNSVFVPTATVNYQQTSVPDIAAFRQAYARYQPNLPLHQWALESWMLGNLMKSYVDTPAPTRKGLVAYLNDLREWKGEGVHVGLDWRVGNPSATRVQDCFTIARWLDSKGGWTEATNKFPFCYPDAHLFLTDALEQGN